MPFLENPEKWFIIFWEEPTNLSILEIVLNDQGKMPSLKEEFNPEEASAEWMWPDASRIKTQNSAAAEYDLVKNAPYGPHV